MDHTSAANETVMFLAFAFSVTFIIVVFRMAYNIGQIKARQVIMMKKINELYSLVKGENSTENTKP